MTPVFTTVHDRSGKKRMRIRKERDEQGNKRRRGSFEVDRAGGRQ